MKPPDTVPAALRSVAAAHPDRVAVHDGDTVLTWSQLSRRVRVAAAGLARLGVEPGDAVAIWSPNTWHWVVGALAVHHAGATLVPVNTRFTGSEAQDVLARSDARALLVADHFLGTDRAASLDAAALPALSTVVRIPIDGNASGWDALADPDVSDAALATADRRADRVTADTVADILYTSGTTGRSKAVACTHAQSLASSRAWAERGEVTEVDRYLVVNPFFHSFGYKAGILACLQTGAALFPHRVFDAGAVLEAIENHRITVLPGPPTVYRSILDHPDRAAAQLASLRLAVTGAATVPVTLIEQMQRELSFDTVLTAYGLTESGGFATMCHPGDDDGTVATTSGRPLPGYEVSIADTGEILVRGSGVMTGYLDNSSDDSSSEPVDSDGWLHTGDIGSLDEAGNLRITDRLKDMFICGGFNVYPAEVEQRVLTLPGVRECAVVGVPDARLGEVGAAVVVLEPDAAPTADAIVDHCRAALANFKVPRSVHVRGDLPRNASGKVLKRTLREELS